MRLDILLLVLAVAVTTAVAEVAGAANLGTSLAFGQIAFAATLVAILLKRP